MTFIKICGITNLEDARGAVEAGADALGFNFYRPSSRYIEPAVAREIIDQLPKAVLTVGVFVNEDTPETVKSIGTEAGIGAIQLHGNESPEYCRQFKDWYLIKALAVDERFDERRALDYDVDAIMLDASHKELRGGTGQVIDWSIAQRVSLFGLRMFLAGGLSPENVSEAIATVNPYGVDSCSRLESARGKKDQGRVKEFVKTVRHLESRP
jgi:phosphoribosylanthranilate isomerase